MDDDYRNTRYCPALKAVKAGKRNVEECIKKDYPRAVDMHAYISVNNRPYKKAFMAAYNYKCAYCGISTDLIRKDAFEIDHYLYEKSKRFASKKAAGYMDNLVLACHDCNHKKSSCEISEENHDRLYPDGEEIKDTFYRDDLYYIRISEGASDNQQVVDFYNQLQMGSEIHRLDYLLMSLIGLQRKQEGNAEIYTEIGKIIDALKKKRNIM